MNPIPSALLEPPAPPAPHGSDPPGARRGAAPFSTVLDDHQARTAAAEGHDRPDAPATPADPRDGHDPTVDPRDGDGAQKDDRDAAATPAGQPAAPLAALLGGVPLPAAVAPAVVARALAAATAPATTAGQPQARPGGTAAASGLPTAQIPTGPSQPAAASALPLGPGAPAPDPAADGKLAGAAPAAAAPAASAPAGVAKLADALQLAAPKPVSAAAPTAPQPAAGDAQTGGSGSGAGRDQAAAQAPSGSAPATAPAPAPSTAPTAAPAPAVQSAASSAPAAEPRGVGLEHAVETVRLALRAAADGGVTHARISLTPRELGGIEVHLRQTADGLVARVVAEHAGAAQLLQQSGGDLRRQLEQQGLNLLRLDIGASNEQGGRASDRRALADGDATGGRRSGTGGSSAGGDPLAALDGAADATATTTLALPNGTLVDVLA